MDKHYKPAKTWACLGCDKTFATLEACERHEAKCNKGGPRT